MEGQMMAEDDSVLQVIAEPMQRDVPMQRAGKQAS